MFFVHSVAGTEVDGYRIAGGKGGGVRMKTIVASITVVILLSSAAAGDGFKDDGSALPSVRDQSLFVSSGKESALRQLASQFLLSVKDHSAREATVGNSCDVCHATRDQICKDLIDRNQQVEIMMWLFDICEVFQRHVDGCKKLVFEYGPLVLAKFYKFMISEDVCQIIRMCV